MFPFSWCKTFLLEVHVRGIFISSHFCAELARTGPFINVIHYDCHSLCHSLWLVYLGRSIIFLLKLFATWSWESIVRSVPSLWSACTYSMCSWFVGKKMKFSASYPRPFVTLWSEKSHLQLYTAQMMWAFEIALLKANQIEKNNIKFQNKYILNTL